MKKFKIVISLLLTLMMVLPLAVPAVSAEEAATPAPGSVLYYENFEPTKLYPLADSRHVGYTGGKATAELTTGGEGKIGDASNHSLIITNWAAEDWSTSSHNELIPAYVFNGLSSFTVSFDMIVVSWQKFLAFTFPSEMSGSSGNWVDIYWSSVYNGNSAVDTDSTTPVALTDYYGKAIHWEFVFTAGAGANDATFTVKKDGEVLSTRSNAHSCVPYGLILTMTRTKIHLDNLQVVNNNTNEVVYLEDYEYTEMGSLTDFYTRKESFDKPSAVGQQIMPNATGHSLFWNAYNTGYQSHSDGQFVASFATTDDLQGATKYTVSFDATLAALPFPHNESTYNSVAYFHLGNNDVGTGAFGGIWLLFVTSAGGDQIHLLNTGDNFGSQTLPRFSILEVNTKFTITYDSENKTFQMWISNSNYDNYQLFDVDFKALAAERGWADDHVYLTNMKQGDIMFGMNNRNMMELDNLLVTAGAVEDRIDYIGVQASNAVTNGKYAVRFVGGIGALDLTAVKEIGFKVVASYGGNNVDYYANGIGSCEYVYERILGSESGVAVTYNASDFGEAYLIALTIAEIPVSAGNVNFTVTPFYVTDAGTTYGFTYDVVCANGAIVSQTLA